MTEPMAATRQHRRLFDSAGDDVVSRIEIELALLLRTLERLSRRSNVHDELDRASYLLARTLDWAGPSSVKRLADLLGLDPTTVTRQVDAMERDGLLHRRSDIADRRRRLVTITEKGFEKMSAVQAARHDYVDRLLSVWALSQQKTFGALLASFNDELAQSIDGRGADH
jgi:DNA-binding MarR family transcriptional regulator